MPGGDGTGPAGLGPMTGRAAGYCAGYPFAGYMNPVGGRGYWGWGRGGGWGRRALSGSAPAGWPAAAYRWPAYGAAGAYPTPYAAPFAPTVTKEQELDALKDQAKSLEDALGGIRKRIAELEAQASAKAE
jgi:hypothetical protein